MKILLYTISDLKPDSLECIDLLFSSIYFDIPVDFAIVTNSDIKTKYYTIIDNSNSTNYIGYLKYSDKIPKDYDYYIYLDSDILYFGNVSDLIDINKDFMIVVEHQFGNIHSSGWHNFEMGDKSITKDKLCINAGSFSIKKNYLFMFDEIRGLYEQYHKEDTNYNVKLEQSLFNYVFYKTIKDDKLENRAIDLHDTTSLFAQKYPLSKEKKLYHFCGFQNSMSKKLENMKKYKKMFEEK